MKSQNMYIVCFINEDRFR